MSQVVYYELPPSGIHVTALEGYHWLDTHGPRIEVSESILLFHVPGGARRAQATPR